MKTPPSILVLLCWGFAAANAQSVQIPAPVVPEPARSASGKTPNLEMTFGLYNGRHWQSITDKGWRIGFLEGLLDGWELRGTTEPEVYGLVILATKHTDPLTFSEMEQMVTGAFNEAENLNLPVGWVFLGCLAVQRGDATRGAVMLALRQHVQYIGSQLAKSPDGGIDSTEFDPLTAIASAKGK